MSLTGSLDDVSVADVIQFINLGGRSGTLSLQRGSQRGEVGFHRGRIISARGPEHLPLGEWLVAQGALSPKDVDTAVRVQRRMASPCPIGKVLIEMGVISAERLRELVEAQIEQAIYGIVTWGTGTFEFRLDELKPIDDLSMSPGDILPDININTQMILLEAARILDERARSSAESGPVPIASSSAAASAAEPRLDVVTTLIPAPPEGSDSRVRIQLVTADHRLGLRLDHVLQDGPATVTSVALRDAGTRLPGESAPIVLVDLRTGNASVEHLGSIRRVRPRATLVGIVDDANACLDAYEHGVLALLPCDPYVIATYLTNLVRQREATPDGAHRPSVPAHTFAKLRRVFGEFRSGLLTATVSLNLMNLVAESVERAVLFVAAPTRLIVLGSHGYGANGEPLAPQARNYHIRHDQGGLLSESLRDARARTLSYEDANLPASFTDLIGRPSSGSCGIFPLLGTRKVIATMYVDNGRRHTPIDDVEFLEVATSQVGMFYENELLRRHLAMNASLEDSNTTTTVKGIP